MKMNKSEVRAIKANLVAIGVVADSYNLESNKVEYQINKTGMRMYCTLLTMLDKTKILNGPEMPPHIIKINTLDSMQDLIFNQKFVDFTPMSVETYMLTKRGMEHVKIMFNMDFNKEPRELATKLNRLFRFGLKG